MITARHVKATFFVIIPTGERPLSPLSGIILTFDGVEPIRIDPERVLADLDEFKRGIAPRGRDAPDAVRTAP
jgi:hypothetical protein